VNSDDKTCSERASSDRTWPLPSQSHAMRMSWHDLLFAHWSFAPEQINALLPNGLTVESFDGRAWVGVVPFRMSDVAPRFVPELPWLSRFPELNIRTYVSLQGKPGVWFFSLDATNPIAVRVARMAFHLPYMDAKMKCSQDKSWYDYRSHRTHRGAPPANFVGKYRAIDKVFYAKPGTLEYWLTARYCLYTQDRKATCCEARSIIHLGRCNARNWSSKRTRCWNRWDSPQKKSHICCLRRTSRFERG